MPTKEELHSLAVRAVRKYDDGLLRDRNVSAVGVGRKIVGSANTDEPCVTIFVLKKVPRDLLPPSALLPSTLDVDGQLIKTDVVEAGPFYLQGNRARIRPAQPGTCIGAVIFTAGTFGAIVIDNLTGEQLILSNSHVLRGESWAPIGSPIVQPAPSDGGLAPADTIATLLRFIDISPSAENLMDAAVARPVSPGLISKTPLNNVPAPSPSVRAVGLLFAGDGLNYSFVNPIQAVLTQLNVKFPEPGSVVEASIGMNVQKTGRTTEKTTGTVVNTHAILRQTFYGIGEVKFRDQIITTKISEGGDSGSLVLEN